jgi:hypothetical protein
MEHKENILEILSLLRHALVIPTPFPTAFDSIHLRVFVSWDEYLHLQIVKILSETLFRRLFPAFIKLPMALTNVPKVANEMYNSHLRGFFLHPIRSENWGNSTNGKEGRPSKSCEKFNKNFNLIVKVNKDKASVADPLVFGPPGSESGSISQRYGSGSGSDPSITMQ